MVSWIIANWAQVAETLAAVVGVASLIVKMTPTLKDDNFLLPIIKFIGKFIALDKYGPAAVNRPN
jgi:hypothetical protein